MKKSKLVYYDKCFGENENNIKNTNPLFLKNL